MENRLVAQGTSLRPVTRSDLSWLLQLVRLTWGASPILASALTGAAVVLGMIPPLSAWTAGMLVDTGVTAVRQGQLRPLVTLIVLQISLAWVMQTGQTMCLTVRNLLTQRVSDHISLLLVETASTFSLESLENATFYGRWERVNQQATAKLIAAVNELFLLCEGIVSLVAISGLLVGLQWWTVILILLAPVPSMLCARRHNHRQIHLETTQLQKLRQRYYLPQLLSFPSYAKDVKLFGLAPMIVGRHRRAVEELYQENRELEVSRSRAIMWSSLLPVAAQATVYFYVAGRIVTHRLSLGAMAQYGQAVVLLSLNLQMVLDSLVRLGGQRLFVLDVLQFLNYRASHPPAAGSKLAKTAAAPVDPTAPLVEFRDVSFSYPGSTTATLSGLNFTIEAGEKVALVGLNGSGKTTVIKLLARLYEPTHGQILWSGRDITAEPLEATRERMAILFQDFARFSMTIGENIGVGRVADMQQPHRIREAAQRGGALDIIARLADGFATPLGQVLDNGTDLSGGQWQKIALSRAAMRDVPLMLFDEPTSAMDAQAERDTFEQILNNATDKTVIFISHRFSGVLLADRTIVLENGRIVENGSHAELMSLGGKYAQLFTLQSRAHMTSS